MNKIPKTFKMVFGFLIIIIMIVIFVTYVVNFNKPKYYDLKLESFHSSDAKLGFHGYIVTSKKNHLYLINSKNGDINEVFIRSNWIDALPTDNIIVYTNLDKVVGICHFDPIDASIMNNVEIIDDGKERIDPSIIKHNKQYFLTSTVVDGLVNRADEDEENGIYTVELYESDDLVNWHYVTDIVSMQNNVEDVELNSDGDRLRLIYEVETIDKGPSTIQMKQSYDGVNWEDPIVLLDNGADNEPASFCKSDDEYWLFFSSDLNQLGSSYAGSQAFMARYDEDFNLLNIVQLNTESNSQVLLYETVIYNGTATVLYSNDYLGKDDLCLENKNFRKLQTLD